MVCLGRCACPAGRPRQVTGTKAELVLRVLSAFGLEAPTTAPAQLLRALVLERSSEQGYLAVDGPGGALCFGKRRTTLHRTGFRRRLDTDHRPDSRR